MSGRRRSGHSRLIGEPAVTPLIQSLKHNHPFIRRGAVQALGVMGESRAVDKLVEALKDADPWVRHEAAVALGRIGDPRAVSALIESLNDPLEHVRMSAMATLCSLGQASISPLIQALVDKNEDISRRAALALATIGEPSVEPLIDALSNQNPGIRKEAAAVLGQIGNTKAIPSLIETLADPDRAVRIDVVKALAALGVPAIAPLMQVFREGDVRTRTGAMEALWMLGQAGDNAAHHGLKRRPERREETGGPAPRRDWRPEGCRSPHRSLIRRECFRAARSIRSTGNDQETKSPISSIFFRQGPGKLTAK